MYIVLNMYLLKGKKTKRLKSKYMELLKPNILINSIQNYVWMSFQNQRLNFLS